MTWLFQGHVDASTFTEVPIGAATSFRLTFDADVADDFPNDPTQGAYPVNGVLVASFGGYEYRASTSLLRVSNDYPSAPFFYDLFAIGSSGSGDDVVGPSLSGKFPQNLGLQMLDLTGTLFSSDRIPPMPPLFGNYFAVTFKDLPDGPQTGGINSTISSAEILPVPEPEIWGMLGVGLVVIALRRRAR